MIKICFVCLGNICRSPMAEFIFRFMLEKNNLQDKISVVSKATSTEEVGNPIYFRAVEVLKSHQIPYRDKQATVLVRKDYDTFDYIIGMDSSNIFHIKRICGDDSENKVFKLLNFVIPIMILRILGILAILIRYMSKYMKDVQLC